MEQIELKIEGMHCSGCSARLEKILNNSEGIDAKVDFETKTATVKYDKNTVKIEDIYSIIEDAGFLVKE